VKLSDDASASDQEAAPKYGRYGRSGSKMGERY
jgi:hypothetical protein